MGCQNIFHQLVMGVGAIEYIVFAHGFLNFAAIHAGIDTDTVAGLLAGFTIADPRHGIAIGGFALKGNVAVIDPPVLYGYAVRTGISSGAGKAGLGTRAAVHGSAGALHGHGKGVAIKGVGGCIAPSIHYCYGHMLGIQIFAVKRVIDNSIHAETGPLLIPFNRPAAQRAFRADFP